MRTLIAVTAIATLLIAVVAIAANAFTMAEKVVVANKLVLIARVPAGGLAADERIAIVNDRLAPILGYELLTPDNIRLAMVSGEWGIFVGDKLLTTITAADAKANGTTVSRLAHVWLINARSAIPEARPFANKYLTR